MSIGMCVFLLVFIFAICYKIKKNENSTYFMNKEYTNILKGIMSIIVVLVHIPMQYSNKIQDAVGSFEYICVTMFFMFSAFGLMYSLENKEGYIKKFLKQRLLVILIPFFIANTIYAIVFTEWNNGLMEMVKIIFGIKGISFVTVLIIFYIVFYIICKFTKDKKKRDILLVAFPIIYSILNYILKIDRWPVEELGFSYGIILYKNFNSIKSYVNTKFTSKLIYTTILSLVLGIFYLKCKTIWLFGEYFVRILLGISIIWFVIQITQIIKINNKILNFLGSISYEIYLLHGLVIRLLVNTNINSSDVFIWFTIVGTILSAFLLNILDKKITKKIKGAN